LEVRLETGRWERMTVAGAPKAGAEMGEGYTEVEDAEHVLFRPTYERLRAAF